MVCVMFSQDMHACLLPRQSFDTLINKVFDFLDFAFDTIKACIKNNMLIDNAEMNVITGCHSLAVSCGIVHVLFRA